MALEVAYFQARVIRKKTMEPCVGGDTFVAELGSQHILGIPHAEDLTFGVCFTVVKVGLTRKRILIFLLASSTIQFCHIKWQPRGPIEQYGKLSSGLGKCLLIIKGRKCGSTPWESPFPT